MQKIVARMRGGLGNQLFIFAYTYYIIKKLNIKEYEIVLDNREYEKYKIRNFEILEIINDKKVRIYDEKKDKSITYEITMKIFHILQKFLPVNTPIMKIFSKRGFLYTKINSEGNIPKNKSTLYVYGYFQDEKMVKEVKDDLLKNINIDINNSDIYLSKEIPNIAVSIRCGDDYIKQGWPICSREYYQNAIKEIINEKYKDKKVNILIFTDEIEKVKKAKLYDNIIYIENRTPIEQFKIMISCDDFIISNSSFSWMGAYLGRKEDSIIIAPEYWFNTRSKVKNSFIYFQKWRIRKMSNTKKDI